jgi:hypothetical protein
MIDLNEEEHALLEVLGLVKPKKAQEKKPTEFKIIHGISTCKLCKTKTTQLIKMAKEKDCWVKQEEVPLLEESDKNLPYEEYETEVRLCWNCKNVFMEKSKEELVEIIINLFNPVMERQEIWKTVKKMKGEKHE